MEAPVDSPPVAGGLDVDEADTMLDPKEELVAVIDIAIADREDWPEDAGVLVLVLLADGLIFHPRMAMAPTVDELSVSVLVVTVQSELSSVYAHVPL